jgi:hypothetical protein
MVDVPQFENLALQFIITRKNIPETHPISFARQIKKEANCPTEQWSQSIVCDAAEGSNTQLTGTS